MNGKRNELNEEEEELVKMLESKTIDIKKDKPEYMKWSEQQKRQEILEGGL